MRPTDSYRGNRKTNAKKKKLVWREIPAVSVRIGKSARLAFYRVVLPY